MSDPKLNLNSLLGRIRNQFLAAGVVFVILAITSIVGMVTSGSDNTVVFGVSAFILLLVVLGGVFVYQLHRSTDVNPTIQKLQEALQTQEVGFLRQKTSGEVSNLFVTFAEASIGLDVPEADRRAILTEYLEQAFVNRAEQLHANKEAELAAWLTDMAGILRQEIQRRKAITLVRKKL